MALVAVLPLSVLTGCGSGEGSTTVQATAPIRLDITWPARTRATEFTPSGRASAVPTPAPGTITAPASARSVVIALQQATFPAVNRKDDLASYTESYTSPTKVRSGPNIVTVTFYADKDGKGAVVGTATKTVNLSDPGGGGAGAVLVVGKVQKVAITSPARLTVGQSATLGLTATDGNGTSVSVSAGSATFSLLSGSEAVTLTPDGQLTAKAAGVGRVQAVLDGKTSEPFEIEARAPGTATAVIATGQSVKIGETKTLEFSFTDADGNPIAYDPAQLTFDVTAGSDTATVTNTGAVTASRLGSLKLKAKIPGLESAETTVSIVPAGSFTVALPADQNIKVSETKNLTVAVKDAGGSEIALGVGAASFTIVRGGESLTISDQGVGTGVAAGYAVVRVTVAGTTSEPQIVYVGDIIANPSGLKYIEKLVGTGDVPGGSQRVTVNYTGSLLTGTIFDSSLNPGRTPFSFTLGTGSVIKGFEEGVSSMKVGGKRLLIIPSDLGYGAIGSGSSIPPNSTLLFDLELLEVNS
jgi:FKBP-type peptidyl-prolyl cis-trans isomerase